MTNPKLRFIGKKNFSDDWLSITFSENFNFIAGKALSRAQLSEEGAVRNVHYGDILIKLPSVVDVSKDVLPYVDARVDVSKVPRLQSGDILFADAAEDLTAGKAVELKHCEGKPVIAGLHTIACRTKEIFASGFLGYYLNSPAFHRQLITLLVGTKVYSLSKNQLLKVSLSKPSIAEQQKIADFFTALDEKIALAERKLTTLQTLKSGLMQKIFNQEIRFKRKNGLQYPVWVLKPLAELARVGDIDHRMPKSVSEGIPYLMTGDFAGKSCVKFDDVKQISEDDYKLLSKKIKPEKGDTILARYASVGAAMYVNFDTRFLVSYSCVIIKPTERINSKFLFYCLTSEYVQQQIKNEINASSQANIGMASVKQLQVVSPTLEEQDRIAVVLSAVDDKIRFATKKVDLLKQQKQAFMQQMFV